MKLTYLLSIFFLSPISYLLSSIFFLSSLEGSDIVKEVDDDLPWACSICRNEFVDPVVTRCGHYFCERCALQNNKKSKKCFNCDEPTMGIFNTAHTLRAKLKQKQERLKRKKAEEEGSDDDKDAGVEQRNPVSVFTSETTSS